MKQLFAFCLAMSALTLTAADFRLMDIPQNELIGGSDLIAVGTVTEAKELAEAPAFMAGSAKIKIEKVIKGAPTDAVTVRYPGRLSKSARGPDLTPGQRRLFFLKNGPGGMAFTQGYQNIRTDAEADDFAQRVAAFPISVALVPPVGPFPVGQARRITAILRNRSNVAISGYSVNVESYFLASGAYDDTARPPLQVAPADATSRPQPLAAGAARQVTADVVGQWPATLTILALDPKLQAPIAVRAVIYVSPVSPDAPSDMTFRAIAIASPWVNAIIGSAVGQ